MAGLQGSAPPSLGYLSLCSICDQAVVSAACGLTQLRALQLVGIYPEGGALDWRGGMWAGLHALSWNCSSELPQAMLGPLV